MATKEEQMDEHNASLEVLAAISWWVQLKKAQGVNPHPKVLELMPAMFKTLDSVYLETEDFLSRL
jgi:hypothetical protein